MGFVYCNLLFISSVFILQPLEHINPYMCIPINQYVKDSFKTEIDIRSTELVNIFTKA